MALKEPGAQALGALLSDKDSWVRCRSASALGLMPSDAGSVIPALVEALHDRDFCVSEKAAIALGAVGEPAVPPLLEALKSNSASARKGAAQALGYMSPDVQKKVGEALLPSLMTKDEFVRGEAAMRITHMGKIGIPVFLAALKEDDVDLRQRAVDGLGEIGIPTPEVVYALIALFKDPQKTLRLKGAVVLGRFGQRDSSVYQKVAPNLASKDKDVLLGTLRALGDMGGVAEPSLPQIVFLLEESPDPDLRNEAAESLINMGTTASMAAAERYTKDQYHRGGHD
ncbi:MAG: HEAT repeat domain-containing protein [Elusimicrobia bacterium]|nr:HEAT repeat domain-containing protein [Elusimicrobiota bacterium]